MRITASLLGLCLTACASSNLASAPAASAVVATMGASPAPAQTAPSTAPSTAPTTAPNTPTAAAGTPTLPAANTGDAPEISRSVGARGGVVVFWPRVAPRSEDPAIRAIAASVQQRLQQLVARALPGRAIDVRPEPERVCPRAGCEAMTVGASLYHTASGGCLVVALISGSGQSPQRLIPWVGTADLRETVVPFREPPESRIQARDMARCADAVSQLANGEAAVVDAIRAAAPSF